MNTLKNVIKSLVAILIVVIVAYALWIKYQMVIESNKAKIAIQNYEREIKVADCMKAAEQKYNSSIASLCANPKSNCKVAIALVAPKLLDPIFNTLNKEQEICVKLASD